MIRVNGKPILPPLMTDARRAEMREWKAKCLELENRLEERRKACELSRESVLILEEEDCATDEDPRFHSTFESDTSLFPASSVGYQSSSTDLPPGLCDISLDGLSVSESGTRRMGTDGTPDFQEFGRFFFSKQTRRNGTISAPPPKVKASPPSQLSAASSRTITPRSDKYSTPTPKATHREVTLVNERSRTPKPVDNNVVFHETVSSAQIHARLLQVRYDSSGVKEALCFQSPAPTSPLPISTTEPATEATNNTKTSTGSLKRSGSFTLTEPSPIMKEYLRKYGTSPLRERTESSSDHRQSSTLTKEEQERALERYLDCLRSAGPSREISPVFSPPPFLTTNDPLLSRAESVIPTSPLQSPIWEAKTKTPVQHSPKRMPPQTTPTPEHEALPTAGTTGVKRMLSFPDANGNEADPTSEEGESMSTAAVPVSLPPGFCRLPAMVKGYLTRRLLRTRKVEDIKSLIRETLVCIVEEIRSSRNDPRFMNQLMNQLTNSLQSFYDLVVERPVADRMRFISQDRELLSSFVMPSEEKGPKMSKKQAEDVVAEFERMRLEQRQLMNKIGELENDCTEHRLVIQTLVDVEPSRKCYRLVGGVLVERTVEEVLPALRSNKEKVSLWEQMFLRFQLDALIEKLQEAVIEKGKALQQYKQEKGIVLSSELSQGAGGGTGPGAKGDSNRGQSGAASSSASTQSDGASTSAGGGTGVLVEEVKPNSDSAVCILVDPRPVCEVSCDVMADENGVNGVNGTAIPEIELIIKASTIDGRRKGACLFCQEYFMDLYLLAEMKTISLKVTTVDMLKPPPDFRSNFEATPPPILIDNGVAVLDNESIERHIMKNIPGGHNLFVRDIEVSKKIENVYNKFKIFLTRKDEHSKNVLMSHLKKIDEHLASKGTRFLTGDTMCCFDCELMPKLQHIRVGGKHFLDFEIDSSLTHLWKYMKQMYSLDAFTQSCPADQDIINHYKIQLGVKMTKHEELESPTYTASIPTPV
ncbi:unnamed protein product [Cyprideis torosa]|uniref:CLIC N-terminal domain-containing protein n=1 Tax=Cyprideis torosa TaxID=163714 RepID=A0A7R8WDK4_9CRUS|nr:unnamed protein product [Cyprideis torosa]CAG0889140.1 unnamed protein product [Cyprideis torosa]